MFLDVQKDFNEFFFLVFLLNKNYKIIKFEILNVILTDIRAQAYNSYQAYFYEHFVT